MSSSSFPSDPSRRQFLRRLAGTGAALGLPSVLGWTASSPAATPVRIRGRVQANGDGVADVPVTDGRHVVDTAADGSFELWSSPLQPFVYLSIPAGYRIPTRSTGVADFCRPITPDENGEMGVQFDLTFLPQSDEQHAFLVLADPQTQTEADMQQFRSGVVPAVEDTVVALGDRPVFGLTCGDITFDSPELYPQYEAAVETMGVPFFQVLGNHDMDYGAPSDDGSAAPYRQQFGPTYYSFDRGARATALFGGDQPERFTWIEPAETGHLFYAPVAPDHGRLRVEATDRFGRTYSAPLAASSGPTPDR